MWECTFIRVGTLNVGTMTGKGIAGRLDGAKKSRCYCAQMGNKVEGSKARKILGGCKLFYNGTDGRRNGIEIVVRKDLVESVLEVKRVSDRLMAVKLEVKGLILNIVSAYSPQVGNSMEKKNNFWQDLDGLVESVSKQERIFPSANVNG